MLVLAVVGGFGLLGVLLFVGGVLLCTEDGEDEDGE